MNAALTDEIERIKPLLEKEIPTHLAVIRSLYEELDKKFHLKGANLPITFGYEPDVLGAYVTKGEALMEHFHFSLLFIGYALNHPLSKSDRMDLYKHEYAHYMQYHISIPKEYTHRPGKHGSAWQYCCSLIGAAPTEVYKAGDGAKKYDYDRVLKKTDYSQNVALVDTYRRLQQAKYNKNRVVKYEIGDTIIHPRYGSGIIAATEQTKTSVRLTIRFGDAEKKIDQSWVVRNCR